MVNNLKRYIKLWWKMAGLSMQLETEYRGSFILEIIVECAFFVATLISILVIYSNVNYVAGWSRPEALILIGFNMVFSEILLGLAFIFNLRELPHKIVRGDLDLVLVKPIDSQFVVSLWRPYFASVPSLMAGIIVSIYGISLLPYSINLFSSVIFLLSLTGGLVLSYSLGMIITTLSMWLINASPLPYLAQQIIFISQNPSGVFSGIWRIIFLTIVPIILMLSIPVEILIGKSSILWSIYIWLTALIFLSISRKFWHFALRHYSSASS